MTSLPVTGDLLRRLAESARALAAADCVTIALIEFEKGRAGQGGAQGAAPLGRVLRVAASEGAPAREIGTRLALENSLAGEAVRDGRAAVANDISHTRRMSPALRDGNLQLGFRSCAAVPLLHRERCLGVLFAHYRRARAATPRRIRLLEAFATSAALAIANAQHQARLEVLLRVARRLAIEAVPERVLAAAVREAVEVIGGETGAVWRWDPEAEVLRLVATSVPGIASEATCEVGKGAVGRAVELRRPVAINDYARSAWFLAAWRAAGAQAVMAAPLMHEGRILGAFAVDTYNPHKRFEQEDLSLLELVAGMVSSILVGLERSQLASATLTARELAHLLNNDLAVPLIVLSELDERPYGLPLEAGMVREAVMALQSASQRIHQLQTIARFTTKETPVGPSLDLQRSAGPPAADAGP